MTPRTPPPSRLITIGRLVGGSWRTVSWSKLPQIGHLDKSIWYSAWVLAVPNSTTQVSQIACLQGSICSGGRHIQEKQVVVDCKPPHL